MKSSWRLTLPGVRFSCMPLTGTGKLIPQQSYPLAGAAEAMQESLSRKSCDTMESFHANDKLFGCSAAVQPSSNVFCQSLMVWFCCSLAAACASQCETTAKGSQHAYAASMCLQCFSRISSLSSRRFPLVQLAILQLGHCEDGIHILLLRCVPSLPSLPGSLRLATCITPCHSCRVCSWGAVTSQLFPVCGKGFYSLLTPSDTPDR